MTLRTQLRDGARAVGLGRVRRMFRRLRRRAARAETFGSVRRLLRRRGLRAHVQRSVAPPPVPGDIPASAEHIAQALQALQEAAASGKHLVCGPWTSEIGFELLYWIPLLRRHILRAVDRRRVTAVSRGGASMWYGQIASHYIDIFDHFGVDEFRQLRAQQVAAAGSQKQMDIGDFDRQILERIADRLPSDYVLVHPSLMYRILWPVWARRLPVSHWQAVTSYSRLGSDAAVERWFADVIDVLPTDFIAAKFYWSDCLPDTDANRQRLDHLVGEMAAKRPLVMLSTSLSVDDHVDAVVTSRDNVIDVSHAMQPASNLALQTAIIRRARAFVGTYGGFSYLAPLYTVPSYSVYSVANFNEAHLDAMRRALRVLQPATDRSVDFNLANLETLATIGLLRAR